MRYRTARLLHTLAARLRKHSRRLGDFFAWNKCLLHVLVSIVGAGWAAG
jgi:acyl-CoA oxidase